MLCSPILVLFITQGLLTCKIVYETSIALKKCFSMIREFKINAFNFLIAKTNLHKNEGKSKCTQWVKGFLLFLLLRNYTRLCSGRVRRVAGNTLLDTWMPERSCCVPLSLSWDKTEILLTLETCLFVLFFLHQYKWLTKYHNHIGRQIVKINTTKIREDQEGGMEEERYFAEMANVWKLENPKFKVICAVWGLRKELMLYLKSKEIRR